ncbi:MAG: ECF transporter S component [Acholeplasmatales bacterium]|jgi:uncharacterized membrane protein|nr:ECF transporter S component [Acholeplasmatales bacterium]
MKKKELVELTTASIIITIIIVMSIVPGIGYITLGGVAITLIHIPALIGIFFLGKKYGIIIASFFGLLSMLIAIVSAVDGIDVAFKYPHVSVLPRVIWGVISVYGFRLLKRIKNDSMKFKVIINIIVVSIVSLLMVLSVLFLRREGNVLSGTNIYLVIGIASFIEILFIFTFLKFENKKRDTYFYIPAAFIIFTFAHTILVFLALFIFMPSFVEEITGTTHFFSILMAEIATNGIIEALLAMFLGTPIYIALNNRYQNA